MVPVTTVSFQVVSCQLGGWLAAVANVKQPFLDSKPARQSVAAIYQMPLWLSVGCGEGEETYAILQSECHLRKYSEEFASLRKMYGEVYSREGSNGSAPALCIDQTREKV